MSGFAGLPELLALAADATRSARCSLCSLAVSPELPACGSHSGLIHAHPQAGQTYIRDFADMSESA